MNLSLHLGKHSLPEKHTPRREMHPLPGNATRARECIPCREMHPLPGNASLAGKCIPCREMHPLPGNVSLAGKLFTWKGQKALESQPSMTRRVDISGAHAHACAHAEEDKQHEYVSACTPHSAHVEQSNGLPQQIRTHACMHDYRHIFGLWCIP
jgi:hypothetical protein